jgi:hypothetical protein
MIIAQLYGFYLLKEACRRECSTKLMVAKTQRIGALRLTQP